MKLKQAFVFFLVTGFVMSLTTVSISYAGSEITGLLKSTIDQVIKIVKDENLQKDKQSRRAALRKTIDQRFNYRQMVMRSLAKNWDQRSDKEREHFILLFKSLLENSYASKLESYSGEKINYLGEVLKGKYALVKTEVVRPSSTIGVDYKLIQEKGDWRVYDFVIEGVSMIRNYRSQFTKIIRKDSYETLVQKLTDKVSELEKETKGSDES